MVIYNLDETPDIFITPNYYDATSSAYRMEQISGEDSRKTVRNIDLRKDTLMIHGTQITETMLKRLYESLVIRPKNGIAYVNCNGAFYVLIAGKLSRSINNVIFDWSSFGVIVPNSVHDSLRKLLEEKDKAMENTTRECELAKNELESTKASLKASNDEVFELKKVQNDLGSKIQKAYERVALIDFELELYKIELESCKKELDDVLDDLCNCKEERAKREVESQNEISSLQSELQSTRDQFQNSNKKTKEDITTLENEVSSLRSELQSTKDHLQNSNKKAKENMTTLENEVSSLRSELHSTKDKLQNSNKKAKEDITTLENEVSSLRSELHSTKDQLQNSNNKVRELEENVSSLQDQLFMANKEVEELKDEIKCYEKGKKCMEVELKKMIKEIRSINLEVKGSNQKLDQVLVSRLWDELNRHKFSVTCTKCGHVNFMSFIENGMSSLNVEIIAHEISIC